MATGPTVGGEPHGCAYGTSKARRYFNYLPPYSDSNSLSAARRRRRVTPSGCLNCDDSDDDCRLEDRERRLADDEEADIDIGADGDQGAGNSDCCIQNEVAILNI